MFSFFEKLVNPYPDAEPHMAPQRMAAFIYHYTKPFLPWLIAMGVLTGITSVIELAFFSFIGSIVDWLSVANRATFFADYGGELLWMAGLILIAFPIATLFQNLFLYQTIYGNYPMLVRWEAHRYLLGQSLTFFHNDFAGRVSQKVMQTALSVRETVTKLLEVFVYVAVYFAGTLILVGKSDGLFLVPLLLWLAGYIAILWIYVPRLQAVAVAQSDARAQMTGRVVDSYTNIQTIKLFAHTRREREYVRDAMDGFMGTVYRQSRYVTELTVILNVLNSLLLAGVAAIAIMGWLNAAVSLGAITVAMALVMRLRAMSQWILWEVAGLFENIGTVIDGITTIAQPVSVTDKPDAKELVVSRGEIRFDHVKFHYGRKNGGVLDDLSLTIAPGEKVGIVGRSGAGKSTMINLLLRFYDLESGRILIDGQDIAGVTQDSLRQQIGLVTQDTSLLHRSIRDNIRYGRPDATEAEIHEAARQAHADEFISKVVDQRGRATFDAHVGERGVKLSGGQRQRVAISRVLLKDAPILVLDEATSALDSEIEAAIQESLYRLMEGKTVIAIAHRLSTIAAMDRLVVLDEGRIVEMGTHAQLLAEGGIYADLWHRQSGGFLKFEDAGYALYRTPVPEAAE